MLRKILFFSTILLLLGQLTNAQVTTSSISGTVKDKAGQPLTGATISAVHTPSGTAYTAIAGKNGGFNIYNMRIGGPYAVTVTFAGQQPFKVEGFNLALGQPYSINAVMGENITALAEVTITASRGRRSATDKNGASTNIGTRQIQTLPTITRSITDFTRLSPQAGSSVTANNTSFGGRDGRYNNVQVDGANLNNNFGLSNDLLPGGGNPISLDAIDEISVNIAPFDVRQSNFTGAGVSAVTKSGTNTFHGSAYTYYRDQSYAGTRVQATKLAAQAAQKNNLFGGTFSGPIIKNKLFFFINGEYEKRTYPGITYTPKGGSGSGNVSDVSIDSLKKLSDYLSKTYNYNTGAYDNFPNFSQINRKLLGKIDWNISNQHRLTLKYSDYQNTNDVALNSLSVPNSLTSSVITSVARFGQRAMSFANSNYGFSDKVRSGTLELNSRFGNRISNQFIATITKIRDTRTSPSSLFPFIDILGPVTGSTANNYLSVGYEPYSYNNDVVNDIYSGTDNFTYLAGPHTLTAGASYEYQKVGNAFMPASQSYYVYSSLNDFITNQAPKSFALTYSLVPGQDAVFSANLKVAQLGIYAQDEFNVNDRFKLTFGVRVDKPVYPTQPLENPAVSSTFYYTPAGGTTQYTTGKWPRTRWYWSPRAGFRWDPEGDKKMIIRGGTGIFTGRIPFVLLTNIPSNSAIYQFASAVYVGQRAGTQTIAASDMANFKFNPDPHAYNPFYNTSLQTKYPGFFPTTAGSTVPTGAFATADQNFRFPQVWRTNLAIDKQLGKSWSATFEALFTKDINAVYLFNANQKAADTVVFTGPFSRPRFSSSAAGIRKLNTSSGNHIVLENSQKGYSFVFTAQVSKNFTKGLYGSLAYTYTLAEDITANPGSQANSIWSVNPTSTDQNATELSYSNFAVPHRLVGTISYRFEYIKHLATTVSLFYEGSNAGTYSYIYNGDLNNDGNSQDLMYIPKDPSEIKFVALAATSTTPAYTAQQQSDAFFAFINQDKYLKKHMGQVATRYGAKYPWYDRLDAHFAQEIFSSFGGRKHSLQITADVTNFLNLLNHNWGARKLFVVNNPLRLVAVTNGVPTYNLTTYTPQGITTGQLLDRTFINNNSTTSTWGLQLGLKYSF